ncbi:AraC family transcriptional regulator [Chitinophaga sp. Cy-1792]|uniref:helix-turn-helix domain-containing protein n=1 Tax=Chitinophaga sp. Cy-1792 TaxID=2608339 RepID=UPI00141E548B|nr:helix-turn-helix domain-containing protein [Chitinophaga sp. Cy-1792]NIG54409.1 AraC family transcriptional regulator [Chitinophaga sp. Cy-1792]
MKNELLTTAGEIKNINLRLKGFKIYEVANTMEGLPEYSRKDFFKICLHHGSSTIHYADKSVALKGYSLFFGTPHIPYSWHVESARHNSFSCIFTEDFLNNNERLKSLQESPIFKIGGTPVFSLTKETYDFIRSIFKKMLEEQDSSYQYKDELIRNYINLIIHEAHKLQPSEEFYTSNAASRIAAMFLELLERQFPIDTPHQSLETKHPQDFAALLNIHVNHLNRAVKQTTGKTTKDHITDRITAEARALLLHTNWNVADIAYALGFEYPTYFNNFFKRVTGTTPNAFRKQPIV